jgi:hypothetical protein
MARRRYRTQRTAVHGHNPRNNIGQGACLLATRADAFDAYGRLPKALRALLQDSPVNWSSIDCLRNYRRLGNVARTVEYYQGLNKRFTEQYHAVN